MLTVRDLRIPGVNSKCLEFSCFALQQGVSLLCHSSAVPACLLLARHRHQFDLSPLVWVGHTAKSRILSFTRFCFEVAPTTAGSLPMLGGRVKPGLLSSDCLHLSRCLHLQTVATATKICDRRANSIFGRNLWNNLMQPWSHKQVSLSSLDIIDKSSKFHRMMK